MGKLLSKEAIEFYSEKFKIRDNSILAYSNVMDYGFQKCLSDIEKKMFIDHFYINSNNIKTNIKCVIQEITHPIYPSRFVFVHGYAKNGKTSFAHYLRYYCKNEEPNVVILPTIHFDLPTETIDIDFKMVVKKVLSDYLKYYSEKKQIQTETRILQTLKLIELLEKNIAESEKLSDDNVNYPFEFILNKIGEILRIAKNQINDKLVPFNTKMEIVNNNIDSLVIDERDASDVMTFYILAYIFGNASNVPETKKKKILVIFDDIDEILSPIAKDISGNYVGNVCRVIEEFDTLFGEMFRKETGVDITNGLSYLFQYRSGNLANEFARQDYLLGAARKENPRYFDFFNAPVHTVSSVHSSIDIIKRRNDLYKELVEFNNCDASSAYKILSSFFKIAEDKNNELKLNEVFRLFNGNRMEALRKFPFERLANLDIPSNGSYSYLAKGIFLFLFLSPYTSNQQSYFENIYRIFSNTHNGQNDICNPSRLILTYIITKTNRDFRQLKSVDSIRNNGVSLFEILKTLQELKCYNTLPYSADEVKASFNQMFSYQVDDYRQLITCTKSTIKKDIEQGKIIQLDEEIDKFYLEYNPERVNESLKRELDNIRLIYNDSALYLIENVITHFEFISLFHSKNTKFLLEGVNEDLKVFYNGKVPVESLPFIQRLNNVFVDVKEMCNSSINHYFNDIVEVYDPNEYCDTSGLAILSKFYFDLMISRHITYIEQFRLYILKEIDVKGIDKKELLHKKIALNNYLLDIIENKYLALFFSLYGHFEAKKSTIPRGLKHSHKAFQYMLDRIRWIRANNKSRFKRALKNNFFSIPYFK
jgi:hypothetical protein